MRYALLFLLASALSILAVPPTNSPDEKATVEATDAAKRATVPAGLKVSLWAAEPLLANPVSFCFDERGSVYVAETTRFGHGVPDTRSHMHWLDDDICAKSVADRLEMYKKHKYGEYSKFDDQVRKVWDSAGKGIADKSTVFAGGFNKPEDGLMSGLLARQGTVYVTNIPSLYALKDSKNEGVADERKVLSTGYGVRAQYLGHDMHGLRMGPDGRLYFSIGDRGFNVINKEGKHLYNPDSGAVLRCEPDGSNLEIVHIGLRNPQELAFDDYGNLFTYDNNCDSGDKARWVHIVPGGDSGWRCGFQYGTLYHTPAVKQGNRGPWNTEQLWQTAHDGQPAYIVPPLLHFGNGPAGLTHYPGLGLNDKYKDHFFACDFTANPGNSVIWSLAVKPKGASFEVINLQPFVKNMVPTDCEFGPDCNLYWSDWVGGWSPPGKGRIFKVTDEEAQKNPKVKEAKELLAKGFANKPAGVIATYLDHPHQQVRQEAQFEIASRDQLDSLPELVNIAIDSKNQIARLHGIWGMGQVYRRLKEEPHLLIRFLKDTDPIIRANAAKTIADCCNDFGHYHLNVLPLLNDKEPLVRFHAAIALHQIYKAFPTAVPIPLFVIANHFPQFASSADSDPNLRHAAVMLYSLRDAKRINYIKSARNNSLSKQFKTVIALSLRKENTELATEQISSLLSDADNDVSSEAARAIYDERMVGAMPALAAMTSKSKLPDAVIFRALAANFYLGQPEHAKRLAEFAGRKSEPDYLRITAMKLLADWGKPPRRDPIHGCRLELPDRDANVAKEALKPLLEEVFSGSDAVRKEAVACVSKLGMKEVGAIMAKIVGDVNEEINTRVEALYALADLKAKELDQAVKAAGNSNVPKLRAAASVVSVKRDPKQVNLFAAPLENPGTAAVEKQMMLASLGSLPESEAGDKLLGAWMDKLVKGDVPAELKLEVFESAEARANAKKLKTHVDFKAKLAEYDKIVRKAAGNKTDKRFPEALAGGDAERGRAIFLNNAAVSCQRCHKLDGEGGDVGPVVNGIGKEKTREYLLESIVLPDAHIAEGFQSVIIETADGKKVSGVLRKKTKEKLTLLTPENKVIEIAAEDVESQKPDKSAMPDDIYKKMTRREMRDVVEFLFSLKDKKP